MNLITQVNPIAPSKWLCEVFIIGGPRIAYAEIRDATRTDAVYFAEAAAYLCNLFRPGKYNIYPGSLSPVFVAETEGWPELEKIGETDLPRQEGP